MLDLRKPRTNIYTPAVCYYTCTTIIPAIQMHILNLHGLNNYIYERNFSKKV